VSEGETKARIHVSRAGTVRTSRLARNLFTVHTSHGVSHPTTITKGKQSVVQEPCERLALLDVYSATDVLVLENVPVWGPFGRISRIDAPC
jgi:hypothetical protein